MKPKICIITGTRAEFGLLQPLMEKINRDQDFILQIIATGTHLSTQYGYTFKEIEEKGFIVDYKVEMLSSATERVSISKSVGLGTIGFTEAFDKLKPNLILLLGDRYELLSAASAALIIGIPIGHIHGGELTEGAFDDAIRHSVTKMSHLHFVAAEEYRQRVVQLGEQPDKVFCVGGLGIDVIKNMNLFTRQSLEFELSFKFARKNLLITFHPETYSNYKSSCQFKTLLTALDNLNDTNLIFTQSNSDPEGNELQKILKNFVKNRPNAKLYKSLGQKKYLSCLKFVDGVIGNSSSGIIEAPFMKIPTINIGDRQKGRLMANSIVNCKANIEDIVGAISLIYSKDFKSIVKNTNTLYGNGGTSTKIIKILKAHKFNNLMKKSFYDINIST